MGRYSRFANRKQDIPQPEGEWPIPDSHMPLPASAGQLAEGIATESRARQQDFANGYMGSQIAPQWTGLLQALHEAGGGREGGPAVRAGVTRSQRYDQAAQDSFQPGKGDLTTWGQEAGATGPAPMPEDQNQWQSRMKQKIYGKHSLRGLKGAF